MPIDELLKLSRDAARRANATMAAERAKGGPGWGARASAVTSGPIAEIAERVGRGRIQFETGYDILKR